MGDSAGGPIRSTRDDLVLLDSPLLDHRIIPLPVPRTPLIGRRTELTDAATLLRREAARPLTLTGPPFVPGSGVSRLLDQWLRQRDQWPTTSVDAISVKCVRCAARP